MTQAYPLQWPEGWPRTSNKLNGNQFSRPVRGESYVRRQPWTFAAARDSMLAELNKLGARDIVVSTNFQLNSYGEPSRNRGVPSDQSIAVYFTFNKRPMVMASDRYFKAENNMRSIALAVDAMRQLERHGGGSMMERAFTGFAALPSPDQKRHWSVILGVSPTATKEEVETAYKALAKRWHPDVAGEDGASVMAEINYARDEALKDVAA